MSDTPAPQTRSIPAVNQKNSLPVKMVKGTSLAMDRVFRGAVLLDPISGF
jgi:hypothetical protein